MPKGTAKQNNRHEYGLGNGKLGKKADRLDRASKREPRSMNERMRKAGEKERKKLGLSK